MSQENVQECESNNWGSQTGGRVKKSALCLPESKSVKLPFFLSVLNAVLLCLEQSCLQYITGHRLMEITGFYVSFAERRSFASRMLAEYRLANSEDVTTWVARRKERTTVFG